MYTESPKPGYGWVVLMIGVALSMGVLILMGMTDDTETVAARAAAEALAHDQTQQTSVSICTGLIVVGSCNTRQEQIQVTWNPPPPLLDDEAIMWLTWIFVLSLVLIGLCGFALLTMK